VTRAFEMIEVAKKAGCNAVKFQTFRVADLVVDPELTYTYKAQGEEITESMLDLFSRYELKREDWFKIKEYCNRLNITFLSTPQNYSDLELLLDVGIEAIKVGSDDFNNTHLLKKYAQTDLPLILSTGMATEDEIEFSLNQVGVSDGYPVILLLCVSEYPAPLKNVNLNRITTLKSKYQNLVIGFSDHTEGSFASVVAIAKGATVIEKHFTLDKNLPGPDHWFSADPKELSDLVEKAKLGYLACGSGILNPSNEEMEMRKIARRSIVVLSDIRAGEPLTEKNIGLRRPGTGMEPKHYEQVLGKTARIDLRSGHILTWDDL